METFLVYLWLFCDSMIYASILPLSHGSRFISMVHNSQEYSPFIVYSVAAVSQGLGFFLNYCLARLFMYFGQINFTSNKKVLLVAKMKKVWLLFILIMFIFSYFVDICPSYISTILGFLVLNLFLAIPVFFLSGCIVVARFIYVIS